MKPNGKGLKHGAGRCEPCPATCQIALGRGRDSVANRSSLRWFVLFESWYRRRSEQVVLLAAIVYLRLNQIVFCDRIVSTSQDHESGSG